MTSRYEGVSWSKCANKWESNIHLGGKNIHLGLFTDEKLAYKAYLEALKGGLEETLKIKADRDKFKGMIKIKNGFKFRIRINDKSFVTKLVKTIEEALYIKQEVLKDFSNLNKYRETPYDLKEEFSKLDMKTLKKSKYFESFKHLLIKI